jgi:hypothetical protein
MKREVGVALGLLAALVAVVLLFVTSVLGWLRPDRAPPDLIAARAARPDPAARRTTLRAAAPPDIPENRGYVAYGRVIDETGEPIEGARVWSGPYETTSDPGGRYELALPVTYDFLSASAFQHSDAFEQVRPARDTGGAGGIAPGSALELDLVLTYRRQVRVFCAGMPDDQCVGLLAHCTSPLLPIGETCHDRGDEELVCECPEGEVAVRGGGRAVRIGPDDDEAWLDFRDTGRIVGQVLLEGEPATSCKVGVIRVPEGLEDLPRGFVSARRQRCEDDGSFAVEGLVEGDWEVIVDLDELQRTLTPRRVRSGRTTDVGDVDLRDGAVISGVLVDGLTGEPLANEPILAMRIAGRGERVTPQGNDSDHDGHFRLSGLPAGRWRLAHPLSPHEFTEVTVGEGEVVDRVDVFTSDATALDVNGFTLTSVDGQLVVDEVVDGSPAELAGLELDDRVLGVSLAGFDLTSLGDDGAAVSRLVLGHWDGPGITLRVQRAGEEVDVPLDW